MPLPGPRRPPSGKSAKYGRSSRRCSPVPFPVPLPFPLPDPTAGKEPVSLSAPDTSKEPVPPPWPGATGPAPVAPGSPAPFVPPGRGALAPPGRAPPGAPCGPAPFPPLFPPGRAPPGAPWRPLPAPGPPEPCGPAGPAAPAGPEPPGRPAPLVDPPPGPPLGAPDLRGANQSLVFSSAAAAAGAGAAPAGASTTAGPPVGELTARGASAPPRGPPPVLSAPSADTSVSVTGVRTTTGGMGRDPGMLIRIRVVSVVSVLRSSGGAPAAERPASAPLSVTWGSRTAASPTGTRLHRARWARRTNCQFHDSRQVLPVGSAARLLDLISGSSAARTTILAMSGPQTSPAKETPTGPAPAGYGEVVRHLPSRTAEPPGCRPRPSVAHITARAIPPSRKR